MINNVDLLDRYAEFEDQIQMLNDAMAVEKEQAVPAEIKAKLDEIDKHYSEQIDALQKRFDELKEVIKDQVLANGATVKGSRVMAVWNKGRVSWDSKLLEGYAVAHSEILVCRKEGDPTVSFRKVK